MGAEDVMHDDCMSGPTDVSESMTNTFQTDAFGGAQSSDIFSSDETQNDFSGNFSFPEASNVKGTDDSVFTFGDDDGAASEFAPDMSLQAEFKREEPKDDSYGPGARRRVHGKTFIHVRRRNSLL